MHRPWPPPRAIQSPMATPPQKEQPPPVTHSPPSHALVAYFNSPQGRISPPPRNLLWLNVLLAGNRRRRYWQPSHLPYHESPLGIERQGNLCPLLLGAKPLWHRGDQLAKETLDHDIDPLTTVHFADFKPLVNSYIQQEVQIKWDVSIHGRDLYLLNQH